MCVCVFANANARKAIKELMLDIIFCSTGVARNTHMSLGICVCTCGFSDSRVCRCCCSHFFIRQEVLQTIVSSNNVCCIPLVTTIKLFFYFL